MFSFKNLGIGTKLTLLVLTGMSLSIVATGLNTSKTFHEVAVHDSIEEASAITKQALSTLEYVDELHAEEGVFNHAGLIEEAQATIGDATSTDEILRRAQTTKIYKTLPVVAAWEVARMRAEELGFEFRTPRLNPRNPLNKADEIEHKLLGELASGSQKEVWYVDQENEKLHYMVPVNVRASCLSCHGTAADDQNGDGRDMFGLPMEGEKVGDLHAGFEVICDLSDDYAEAQKASMEAFWSAAAWARWSCSLLFFIRRSVTRPLAGAFAVLDQVAQGDFTQRLQNTGKDELGRMSESLNKAVGDIAQAMGEVRSASVALVHASNEVSQTTTQMSEGSQQQASALEETAASLEQITGTVKQNADSARQANQLASASRDVAEKGGKVVADAVVSIQEISKSSEKIANIITTIDEIAFQTNLLALNAAVEAARAGEQGRGFAVVASEVRNLAQRSASTAKEIKSLIEESLQKVQAGSELVNKSGQSLNEIMASVKRVTDIISEIAAASQEQATGVDQVNRAVTQMDQVVQQNAGQASELAGTAQSLSTQAQQLQGLVSRFKVAMSQEHEFASPAPRAPAPRPSPTKRAAPAASSAPVRSALPSAARKPAEGSVVATSTKDEGFIEF